MNSHLVILKKVYVDAVLAGRKTIESRFYRTRHKWLSQIDAGDRLFLKVSSGPVMAEAIVDAVKHFENLNPQRITELKDKYNKHICGDEQYWRDKMSSQFGILIRLKDANSIRPRFIKKNDWHAWVVLTPKEHFGLLSNV